MTSFLHQINLKNSAFFKFLFAIILVQVHIISAFGQSGDCKIGVKIEDGEYNRFSKTYYNTTGFEKIKLCKNSKIDLIAKEEKNTNYQWYFNGNLLKDSTKVKINISEPGEYYVKAKYLDSNCEAKSESINIDLIELLPNISLKIKSTQNESGVDIICGNSGLFNVDFPILTYQSPNYFLFKDGIKIIEQKNHHLFFNEPGVYQVIAKVGECQSISNPIKIEKGEPQKEYGNAFSNVLLEKQSDSINKINIFHCNTYLTLNQNPIKESIIWKKNGINLNSTESFILDVTEGKYEIYYKEYNGCTIKDSVEIINNNKTSKIKLNFDNSTCTKSLSIPFYYVGNHTFKATVKWYKNNVLFNTQQNSTIVYFYGNESAVYKAIVEFTNCQTYESEDFYYSPENFAKSKFKLVKHPYYEPQLINKIYNICQKASLYLEDTDYSRFGIDLFKNGFLYKSYIPSVENPFNYNDSIFEVSESGEYFAKLRLESNCESYSDTIRVNVLESFPININLTKQNCISKISVSRTDGVKYQWYRNEKVIINATGTEIEANESGKYTLISALGDCIYESNIINFKKEEINKLENSKTTFCIGETLYLNAPKVDNYSWIGPNGYKSNQQSIKIEQLNIQNSGLYLLEMSKDGCITKDSVQINVKPKANFNVIAPNQICDGSQAIFIFSTFVQNYQVQVNYNNQIYYNYEQGYITISNLKASNSNLNFKLTSSSTCETYKSIDINIVSVAECKEIKFINTTKSFCFTKDNSIDFETKGTFATNETYYLYYLENSGKKTLLDSTKTKSFNILANTGNKYLYKTLVIESRKDKIISNQLYIGGSTPTTDIANNGSSACFGYEIPLEIDKNGYFNGKIENIIWKKDGQIIPNSNGLKYLAKESGTYSVSAEIDGCPMSIYNNNREIIIGQIAKPQLLSFPIKACNGGTYNLQSYYYGFGNYNYQWLKDGKEIENGTEQNFTAKTTGNYQIKVSQGACSEISNTLNIRFGDELHTPEIFSILPKNKANNTVEICEGLKVDLYLQEGTFYSYNTNFEKTWELDGTILSLPDIEYYLPASKEGVYRVKIKQNDCITYSNPIIVKFKENTKGLRMSFGNLQACEGDSLGYYSYDISQNLYSIQRNPETNFKVSLLKDGIFNKEIKLYETDYIKQSGKYHIAATFNLPDKIAKCTVYSDTLNIKVGGNIITTNTYRNNYSVCEDTLNLQFVNEKELKNQWKFNNVFLTDTTLSLKAIKSGNYQYISTDKNGCKNEYSVLKVELNKINATIAWGDSSEAFCKNSENYLYANLSSYDKNEKLEWLKDGKIIGNSYSVNAQESGKYTLNLTQGACSASASVDIKLPEIDTRLTPNIDSLFICPNNFTTLIAPKSNTYNWLENGINLNQFSQQLKVEKAGKYKVWVEKDGCGAISKSILVKEGNGLPTAIISGGGQVSAMDSAQIKVDFTSSAPWIFAINNGSEISTEQNPYLFKVKNTSDAVYELKSVKNGCGAGTVSGKATFTIILADEEIDDASIKIGPNPASDFINISVKNSKNSTIQMNIFTTNGRKLSNNLAEKFSNIFEKTIDLSEFPASTYLLKIIIDGKINTYKLIKQ